MKLEIEFENKEDLRKKLSSLLPDPITPNIRPCYTVEEIKLYDDVYQNNYFDIIRNGRTVIRARNYEETIVELHAITTDKDAIIIQNPSCLSDIYVFVSI